MQILTSCAMSTNASIFVPLPIVLFERDPRALDILAQISTLSPMMTPQKWGNLSNTRLSRYLSNPKPSAPIVAEG